MLDVIESVFTEHTIISIVHRYTRIESFDRVAVLDQGQIVEIDTPQALLGRHSVFSRLYKAYIGNRGALLESYK